LRLQELSFILTEDCNFRCAYCPQARGTRRLERASAALAVLFFRRFLGEEAAVCFYGGEPLLAFPVLKDIVERLDRGRRPGAGKIRYAMTTNGSLLTPEILRFLERRRFSLILSFDGLAQDIQRRPGSYATMVALIREILARPSLRLEVNSVFTSRTVGLLRRSVEEMLSLGVGTVHLSFPTKPPWDGRSLAALKSELAALRPAMLSFFRTRGDFPVSGLRGRAATRGLFTCFAGRDRLAVGPDGTVWGCGQIFDYSKRTGDRRAARFAFGEVASLAADPGRLERRRSGPVRGLDQADLSTPESDCLACPDVGDCAICPWSAALESGDLGLVSGDACRITKLFRSERRALQEACERISRPSRRDGAGRPRPRPARDPRLSRARGISGRLLERS
jgi:MoaA/NifB/PqqE/SkfB family radical SAM enzyme